MLGLTCILAQELATYKDESGWMDGWMNGRSFRSAAWTGFYTFFMLFFCFFVPVLSTFATLTASSCCALRGRERDRDVCLAVMRHEVGGCCGDDTKIPSCSIQSNPTFFYLAFPPRFLHFLPSLLSSTYSLPLPVPPLVHFFHS